MKQPKNTAKRTLILGVFILLCAFGMQAASVTLTSTEGTDAYSFASASYANYSTADVSYAGASDKALGATSPVLYTDNGQGAISAGDDCAKINWTENMRQQEVTAGKEYCVRTLTGTEVLSIQVTNISKNWEELTFSYLPLTVALAPVAVVINDSDAKPEVAATQPVNNSSPTIPLVFLVFDILLLAGIFALIYFMVRNR